MAKEGKNKNTKEKLRGQGGRRQRVEKKRKRGEKETEE